MSLVNNTTLHVTTGLFGDSEDTFVEEVSIKVIEHGGTAYVEVAGSGVMLSHNTLGQLTLMVELHQRRINTK